MAARNGPRVWAIFMADLSPRISDFLTGTRWQNWRVTALAGDASARRYLRLTGPGGDSAILMDADPATGEDTAPFLAIAAWLDDQGLRAPRLLHGDRSRGLLVLEDLGTDTIATAATTVSEDVLYDAAVDVLIRLDGLTPPGGLPVMTPDVGAQMIAITAQNYHSCDPGPLVSAMKEALQVHAPTADRMALRDYHAENLIWRPDRVGTDRIGLLDFQDAFVAPRGYDLASLLRDIRRTVSPAQVVRQTGRFADALGADRAVIEASFATLGAQRNLRILGVFARLAQNGKPRYAALLPAVWDALLLDLAHPALTTLRGAVLGSLPPPQDRP